MFAYICASSLALYAVSNILITKYEGYRHATYQQIVVYTRDLFTRIGCDTYFSVKPQLLKKTVDFSDRQEVENQLVKYILACEQAPSEGEKEIRRSKA